MTLNYVCSHGVQLFELTVLIYISLTSNQNDSTIFILWRKQNSQKIIFLKDDITFDWTHFWFKENSISQMKTTNKKKKKKNLNSLLVQGKFYIKVETTNNNNKRVNKKRLL